MAIYRPPKRRWPLAVGGGTAGVVVGLLLGLVAFNQEPDPALALREVRASLTNAASVLEIVEIEYSESVADGEVVRDTEYQGAKDALARSRASFREAKAALAVIVPGQVDRIEAAYDEVERLMAEPAPVAELKAATEELAKLLEEVSGG